MICCFQLNPKHFDAVIALGNAVHGDNYLDHTSIQAIYDKSWQANVNCSWVAIDTSYSALSNSSELAGNNNDITNKAGLCLSDEGLLVGFRLTYAPSHWSPDKWCSPQLWSQSPDTVCYFKCNTVNEHYRGSGIGKQLLLKSIESAKQQGAKAGLAHIWLASPNNSAFGYFSACGGKLIKTHPNKWQIHSVEDDYDCPICDELCCCEAAEMLLVFGEQNKSNT